jgi:hypothetical protein
VNPHGILGVRRDAGPDEVAASYRALAKRWHPDRGGGAEAERRMAEINAAYDLLRSGTWQDAAQAAAAQPAPARRPPRAPAGAWLEEPVRRALGPELLSVLQRDEEVSLVTPTSVWASPQALLAVTDRRLLWLLDDAVSNRVRSLAFEAVTDTATKLAWPRRRRATLRVGRRNGRRPIVFGDLRPETAEAILRHVRTRAAAA